MVVDAKRVCAPVETILYVRRVVAAPRGVAVVGVAIRAGVVQLELHQPLQLLLQVEIALGQRLWRFGAERCHHHRDGALHIFLPEVAPPAGEQPLLVEDRVLRPYGDDSTTPPPPPPLLLLLLLLVSVLLIVAITAWFSSIVLELAVVQHLGNGGIHRAQLCPYLCQQPLGHLRLRRRQA